MGTSSISKEKAMWEAVSNIKGEYFLAIGAFLCLASAFLHLLILFPGSRMYKRLVTERQKRRTPKRVAGVFAVINALVFTILALYGFSGAQLIPALPYVGTVLITAAYVLFLCGIAMNFSLVKQKPLKDQIIYLMDFLIGCFYFLGHATASGKVFPPFFS